MSPEAPIQPRRLHFVREVTEGVIPDNPEFKLFSDVYTALNFNVDPNISNLMGIGDDDILDFNRGQDDNTFSIDYYLQRWFLNEVIADPATTTEIAIKSTDASDTSTVVTLFSDDNMRIEDVSLDGTDGTTLVSTTKTFESIGKVEIASGLTGTLEIYENDGTTGSPTQGTKLGEVAAGDTSQEDVEPIDPAYDGMESDVDNAIPNTHGIVERGQRSTGGVANGGIRTFLVVKGGNIGEVTIDGTLEGGEPVPVSLDYTPEKVRVYRIDQPAGDETLKIASTDSGDTAVNVTIESEGGTTSETLATDGADATTKVTTSATFDNIDAVELASEISGNLQVFDSSDNVLMTIYGTDEYDEQEGDLGVPTLGSGSRESSIGNDFVVFSGTEVERPNNTKLAETITSFQFSVSRNLQTDPDSDSIRRQINSTERVVSVDSTIFEEHGRHNVLKEKTRATEDNVLWKMTVGGTSHNLQIPEAVLNTSGEISESTGEGTISIDVTHTGKGLNFDA